MKRYTAICIIACAAGIIIGTHLEGISEKARITEKVVVFGGPRTFSLIGRVYYPRRLFRHTYPAILFCHGLLPAGKDTQLYRNLLRDLAGRGYLVFSFDMLGFGDSRKAASFRAPDNLDFVADVEAALDYMADNLPVKGNTVTIVGHSMGANLALAVGAHDPRIKNIIMISPGNFNYPDRYSSAQKQPFIKKLSRSIKAPVSEDQWDRLGKPLNIFQYLPVEQSKNIYIILAEDDRPNIFRYSCRFFKKLDAHKDHTLIPNSNHNFGAEYQEGNEIIDPEPCAELAAKIDAWIRQRP
jgi:pimeloyl-ACP methyl ester carboxylesterase